MPLSSPDPAGKDFGLRQIGRLTEGISQGELAAILQAAAKDAEIMIAQNLAAGTVSGAQRAQQLRAAVQGLGSLSSSMWGAIGAQVREGVHDAAQLAATQKMDRDFLKGMPWKGIREYEPGMVQSAFQSAEDIISRRTNGFTLSERIYANGRQGVLQAGRMVDRGLALGQSADEIAAHVAHLYRPDVPGGQSYAARRLARTEINNAHHETTIRLAEEQPWVNGLKWNLSSSHPRPDPCDRLASFVGTAMGEGAYYKTFVPRKPHPQCLCYLTVIQQEEDDFLDALVSGAYDQYMEGQ